MLWWWLVGSVSIAHGFRERWSGGSQQLDQIPACEAGYYTEPETLRSRDYKSPAYVADTVDLYFHLDDTNAEVRAEYGTRSIDPDAPLVLYGDSNLHLLTLEVQGQPIPPEAACINSNHYLVIDSKALPDDDGTWNLTVIVQHNPTENTALFGLYKSEDLLITQNEAHGFRRIVYSFDRPDVQSVFTTTLDGSAEKYPVLLANGNKIKEEEDGDRHSATFFDPSRKPTYLFALVAGPLEGISLEYTRGRPCEEAIRDFYAPYSFKENRTVDADPEFKVHDVDLYKYCEAFPRDGNSSPVKITLWGNPGETDLLRWALAAVEKAMLWDEIRFGLLYDLEEFHVVAASYFNAGAMENKGLNIFNTALILASPRLSTDHQLERIQGVIAHEYFHNWSGDRVTVRDWFQLTLKEGFTVYRDQEFTSDITRSSNKRLADIAYIQLGQFDQDRSALSHPIRPSQLQSVENLYTVTVYEKGAEVIRMYATILGWEKFRAGTNAFFAINDGKSATCEDFLAAMEGASGLDLSQFMLWYSTAGTPTIKVSDESFDESAGKFSFTLTQESNSDKPMWIPVRAALISRKESAGVLVEELFHLREESQTFVFDGVREAGILSVLRGFSAPVYVVQDQAVDDLKYIAMTDDDIYSKWKAMERIYQRAILSIVEGREDGIEDALQVYGYLLREVAQAGDAYSKDLSILLSMPKYKSMETVVTPFKPREVHAALKQFRTFAMAKYGDEVDSILNELITNADDDLEEYDFTPEGKEVRALRNLLLSVMVNQNEPSPNLFLLLVELLDKLQSGTDQEALMQAISDLWPATNKEDIFEGLLAKFKSDLEIDMWFRVQARSRAPDVLATVKKLTERDLYKGTKNPNRLRALMRVFAANPVGFHDESGEGYKLVAAEISRWDTFNPKLAAQLATSFDSIHTWDESYQREALAALGEINLKEVSKNVREVLGKILKVVDPSLLTEEQLEAGKDEL